MKKYCSILFKSFIFLILFSCERVTPHINEVIKDYAIKISKSPGLKNKKYLISVKLDSVINDIKIYRLTTRLNLLEKEEIPDSIKIVNGVKLVFFNKGLINKDKLDVIKKELTQKAFYNIDDKYYNSNYPQYIVLTNQRDKVREILKDLSYYPLDSIINRSKLF